MNKSDVIIFKHIQESGKISYALNTGEKKIYLFLLTPKHSIDVDISIHLKGKQTNATAYAIVIPQGLTDVHLTTRQLHESGESTSKFLLHSLVLSDSLVSYNGTVYIGKQAKGSDAFQQHDSMLLSPHARVQTRPTLEILNNNVSCKHGATIHPMPSDMLWYAKTRGVNQKQAEALYIDGFIKTFLLSIPDSNVCDLVYNQCRKIIDSYDRSEKN